VPVKVHGSRLCDSNPPFLASEDGVGVESVDVAGVEETNSTLVLVEEDDDVRTSDEEGSGKEEDIDDVVGVVN
jgi:hypothetical protein